MTVGKVGGEHPLETSAKCKSENISHTLEAAPHPPLSLVMRFLLSLVKAILGGHRQLQEYLQWTLKKYKSNKDIFTFFYFQHLSTEKSLFRLSLK